MAIYLVGFKKYKEDFKVGRSTNTRSRIEQHLKSLGSLSFIEEYIGNDDLDKSVERHLLKSFRGCSLGEVPAYKQHRCGWTEFIPYECLQQARDYLELKEYARTELSISEFPDRELKGESQYGNAFKEVRRSLQILEVVDWILLTCGLCKSSVPNDEKEFDKMCVANGFQVVELRSPVYLAVAKSLEKEYPYGILQLKEK